MLIGKKLVRIAAGFALLIIGALLAFPGVPGPGIPLILLGLALLSRHFAWAEKAKSKVGQLAARLYRGKRRPG
jgi:hypothetical protein